MPSLKLDDLPKPQRDALIDVVVRNGLDRFGVMYDGSVLHKPATMQALQRRGAVLIITAGVDPTPAGRKAVIAAFGSITKAYLEHRP